MSRQHPATYLVVIIFAGYKETGSGIAFIKSIPPEPVLGVGQRPPSIDFPTTAAAGADVATSAMNYLNQLSGHRECIAHAEAASSVLRRLHPSCSILQRLFFATTPCFRVRTIAHWMRDPYRQREAQPPVQSPPQASLAL